MQIAVAMAGYNPGEADKIRKAVAKKKKKLMEQHKRKFRKGAIKKGFSPQVADEVWGDIEYFARYGFNRAHATDYAVITGQTAYLKAHYPLEFMTALMTTERHNVDKLGALIADARRNDLEVRRPCVNRSDVEFSIEHDPDDPEHRFTRIGLGAIKNVGDDAVRLIVEAREEDGEFTSLDDFADRVDLRQINKRTLEYLIQAGALDTFGERPALLTLTEKMVGASAHIHEARDVGQITLFGGLGGATETLTLPDYYPPIPNRRLLDWEKELLGIYLSEHPLEKQERELLDQDLVNTTIARVPTEQPKKQLTFLGMIRRVRRITTKKGDPMAFVTLEGPGGSVDGVVFPRIYERFKAKLIEDRILVVSGKLDNRADREEHSLLVDWFKAPDEMLRADPNSGSTFTYNSSLTTPPAQVKDAHSGDNGASEREPVQSSPASKSKRRRQQPSSSSPPAPEPPAPPATLYITFQRTPDQEADYRKLSHIHQVLQKEDGEDTFIIRLENGGQTVELRFPNDQTRCTAKLQQQIREIVGKQNLRVVNRSLRS